MPKAKSQAPPATPEEKQHAPLEYDINIYPSRGDGAQKANASVSINGGFAVRGIKIMEGSKGLFVSMPSYRAGNGEYKDLCFPCTKDEKARFDEAVLTSYEQTMAQRQTAAPQETAPAPQQEQSQPVMAGM